LSFPTLIVLNNSDWAASAAVGHRVSGI